MRITGDNDEGKAQLDNFIDPEKTYPVIACTSRLMSTGVDAQTCHLIVLDRRIASMTEFKQIIGRGTRINEDGNEHIAISDLIRNPRDGSTVITAKYPHGYRRTTCIAPARLTKRKCSVETAW